MDLNVVIEEFGSRDPQSLIIQKIKCLAALGYRTIALAVKLPGDVTSVPEPPMFKVEKSPVTVLTRLTVQLEDTGTFYKLSQSPNMKKFDILAIEPMNEKMMNQFCGGQLDCDILCLTMSSRLEVDLKRANLALPVSRSICLEINYGEALVSSSSRINLFSASQLLIEKSRGKNIIISSGTNNSTHLRAPYDVSNLGLLFGLKENTSKEAVFKNGQLVLRHGESRRNSCSRAVKIESIPG